MFVMSFQLQLIRHGQSANNALPESRRIEDPGLTEEGVRQAGALAKRLAGGTITHLLTSGFLRAVQTTRPLAAELSIRPAIWLELHEVGGCYAGYEPGKEVGRPGMNRDQLATHYPEFDLPEELDDHGWWGSKPYETWEQGRLRAEQQVQRLVGTFNETNADVACVIHADFKSLLLEAMVPERSSDFAPIDLKNTGVTVLRYVSPKFEVLRLNDTEHLS